MAQQPQRFAFPGAKFQALIQGAGAYVGVDHVQPNGRVAAPAGLGNQRADQRRPYTLAPPFPRHANSIDKKSVIVGIALQKSQDCPSP